MAQTPDEWLWLGGPAGLSRFDGIRAVEVKIDADESPQSPAVSMLYALPTGELLIGRAHGGITILKDGRLSNFDTAETRRAGSVRNFSQDADGVLWASTANGLLRYDGRDWQFVGDDWGYPEGGSFGLMLDQHGTLWVATSHEVLSLSKGSHKFEAAGIVVKRFAEFIQSPDGRAWVYRDQDGMQVLPGQTLTTPRSRAMNARWSSSILFDSQGAFWDLAPDAGAGEREVAGLYSLASTPSTILEDTEGNIWLASANSVLHRLRRTALAKVLGPSSSKVSLAADGTGRMWMAVSFGLATDKREGVWVSDPTPRHIQAAEIKSATTLALDPGGTLWAGGRDGLWRLRGDRFERAVGLPKAALGEVVNAVSPNCAGSLWVSVRAFGLWRHDGIAWVQNGGVQGLPRELPTVQVCDSTGRLWLGYPGSVRIFVFEADC